MSTRDRKVILTVIVAATAAVFADHILKPSLKRKLKV